MATIGTSGSTLFRAHYGLTLGQTDYNNDLQPPESYKVYDRMRRSDGTIAGALRALTLPLVGATWEVEPGGDSPRDIEAAEFAGENLLGADEPWVDRLRHILLFLPFGAMPFELTFEPGDWRGRRMFKLAAMGPRMPATITDWLIDEADGLSLRGVVQETYTSGGTGGYVEIPAENLLVFVGSREGADWRGVSILRPAYRAWDFKQRLELVQAMSVEKRGVGTDVGTLKGDVAPGSEEERRAKAVLMARHAHEKGYVLETDSFAYRVEGVTGAVITADTAIEHHKREILHALSAEHLGVGADGTGSYALSRDKSSLYIQQVAAWGGIITETINRALMPRLVVPNFGDSVALPRLVHSRLDVRDVTKVATALNQLAGGQPAITIDDGIEAEARDMLELPAKQTEGRQPFQGARRKTTDTLPTVAQAIDAAEAAGRDVTLARKAAHLLTRAPRGAEWYMDLAKIDGLLESGVEQLVRAAKSYEDALAQTIAEEVALAVEDGTLADLDPREWDMPDDTKALAAVVEVLRGLAERGAEEAEAEVRRQGVKLSLRPTALAIPDGDQILEARARAYLAIVAQRMLAVGTATALDAIAEGADPVTGVVAALSGLSDRFLRVEGGKTTTHAVAVGRKAAQEQMAESDGISHAEYTALLDGDTCTECAAVDNREQRYEVGSAEYLRVYPPYRDCLGRARCRCQMVLVADEEITRTG